MVQSRRTASTWRLAAAAAILLAAAPAANSAAVVAGIDFSSKFLKAVVVQAGSPFTIVTNPQSKRKTSANVAFYRGERLFGYDADGIVTRKPKFTFPSEHSLLGATMDSPRVAMHNQLRYASRALEAGNRSEPVLVLPDHPDAHPEAGKLSMLPETYAAQLLGHMQRQVETQAGAPLTGAVVAVPAFWGHTERTAVLQAAAIAGVKVLRLVDENVAAAAQFGIDRVYPNDTHVLIYNMGATATQATLFRFGSYKARDGSVRGTAIAVGKGWDESLGGDALDRLLVEHMADVFNAKYQSRIGADIRTQARPMAKLVKAVGKVKQVLSANLEFPVSVESIATTEAGDIDFRAKVTRETLLSLAKGLIERVPGPALQACRAAGVDPVDVEVVEIIGGSIRVPAFQEALSAAMRRADRPETVDPTSKVAEGETPIPIPALGVHLNGDEAVAFGAAFMAANLSKSFRVRPVGLQDTVPFAITAEIKAAGEAGEASVQRMPPYSRTGFTRTVYINTTSDVDVVLSYEQADADAVAPGLGSALGTFRVSGIEEAANSDIATKHGLAPNVSVRVAVSKHGTVTLIKGFARVRYEEEVAVEPEPTKAPAKDASGTKEAAPADAAADDAADASEDSAEEGDGAADSEPSANDEAGEATPEVAEGKDAAELASDDAAPATEEAPKTRMVARVAKFPLKIERVSPAAGVAPLSSEEVSALAAEVAAMQRADDERIAREQAKNDLESAVMAGRELSDEATESFTAVTSEEQRTELDALLETLDEWLYGDGAEASIEDVRAKRKELDSTVGPMRLRMAEMTARPKAVDKAAKAITKLNATVAGWADSKPWISEVLTETASKAVTDMADWLEGKLKEQSELADTETPAFLSADVKGIVKAAKATVARIGKTPKPKPSPSPSPEAEAEAGTADAEAAPASEGATGEEPAEGAAEEAADEEAAAQETAQEPELATGEAEAEANSPAGDEGVAAEPAAASDEL